MQKLMAARRMQPRVEDDVLVRGNGRYAADNPAAAPSLRLFCPLAARFRPHRQHGRQRRAGRTAACSACSPRRIWTASAASARHPPLAGRGGKALIVPHRPALAAERVMHVGEPVAMVVAETAAAAQDAAELVAVEYEPLTPVIDARAKRSRPARRKSGRRHRATSPSTGRGRRRTGGQRAARR